MAAVHSLHCGVTPLRNANVLVLCCCVVVLLCCCVPAWFIALLTTMLPRRTDPQPC